MTRVISKYWLKMERCGHTVILKIFLGIVLEKKNGFVRNSTLMVLNCIQIAYFTKEGHM